LSDRARIKEFAKLKEKEVKEILSTYQDVFEK
jgi:hypothetical protein